MATRRRARLTSLTTSMSDVRQRLKYLEARPSRSRLANSVVRRTNIRPRSVATDQLEIESVNSEILADDAVTTDKILDRAVTTDKIEDDAITSALIGAGQVQNGNLNGGAVDGRVLADNAVEARHIKDGEVKTAELGLEAVTSEKIKGEAVTEAKLGGEAVTEGKIKAGAVTETKIGPEAVTTGKIKALNVTNAQLADDSVSIRTIRDDNVRTRHIAPLQVENEQLARFAVGVASKIADGIITRDKMAFTAVETVVAGRGLSGGGSGRSVTLNLNATEFATSNHTHPQYATSNHTHDNYARSGHSHSEYALAGHSHGSSSIKLKTDVSDYEFSLEKLENLSLKRFKFKNGYRILGTGKEWEYGFIAEDLDESGLQEFVDYDKNGEPRGVAYVTMASVSLSLIAVLSKRLSELTSEVESLKNSISEITER